MVPSVYRRMVTTPPHSCDASATFANHPTTSLFRDAAFPACDDPFDPPTRARGAVVATGQLPSSSRPHRLQPEPPRLGSQGARCAHETSRFIPSSASRGGAGLMAVGGHVLTRILRRHHDND